MRTIAGKGNGNGVSTIREGASGGRYYAVRLDSCRVGWSHAILIQILESGLWWLAVLTWSCLLLRCSSLYTCLMLQDKRQTTNR